MSGLTYLSPDSLRSQEFRYQDLKGLLPCFSTRIEITGNNLENIENCEEKFQRVKKL